MRWRIWLLILAISHLNSSESKCQGHEPGCRFEESSAFGSIQCPTSDPDQDHKNNSNNQGKWDFFHKADYGYIKRQRKSLKNFCQNGQKSWLKCSRNLEFCVGKSIRIDFRDLNDVPAKYNTEVFSRPGQISASCHPDPNLFSGIRSRMPLQSWSPELANFAHHDEVIDDDCDVIVTKPTMITKLDSTSNMYHHFCDFFNMFTTLKLNSSINNFNNSFQKGSVYSQPNQKPKVGEFKDFSHNSAIHTTLQILLMQLNIIS